MNNSLKHYGIKGQKWGVKHGPPYPLDSDTNAKVRMSSEQEHDYREYGRKVPDNLLNLKNEKISELKKFNTLGNHVDYGTCRKINHPNGELSAGIGRSYNCPNCAMAFEMVNRGYDVHAKPAQRYSNVGDVTRFFKDGKLDNVTPDKLGLKKPMNYDYFMKSRGVPTDWRNKSNSVYQNGLKALREYQNIVFDYEKKYSKAFTNYVLSLGNNSRGIFIYGHGNNYGDFSSKSHGFHAINFIVKDGKVLYYDTQRRWSSSYGYDASIFVAGGKNTNDFYVMRTDNLEINDSVGEAVESNK